MFGGMTRNGTQTWPLPVPALIMNNNAWVDAGSLVGTFHIAGAARTSANRARTAAVASQAVRPGRLFRPEGRGGEAISVVLLSRTSSEWLITGLPNS
jgi:hypothetical protein